LMLPLLNNDINYHVRPQTSWYLLNQLNFDGLTAGE
jgi:hypothetical protein